MTCGSAGSIRTMLWGAWAACLPSRRWPGWPPCPPAAALRQSLSVAGSSTGFRLVARGPASAARQQAHLFLGEERIAQLLGPVELVVHGFEHLRKRNQRLDADVPRLVLRGFHRGVALEVRMRPSSSVRHARLRADTSTPSEPETAASRDKARSARPAPRVPRAGIAGPEGWAPKPEPELEPPRRGAAARVPPPTPVQRLVPEPRPPESELDSAAPVAFDSRPTS